MRSIRLFIAASLLALSGLMLSAPVAGADPVSDAVAQLRSGDLYLADSTGLNVDRSAAEASLSGSRRAVKIAVLPPGSGSAGSLARSIGQQLGATVTVGVFTGTKFDAASDELCANVASAAAKKAVADNVSQLRASSNITSTIKSFISLISSAKTCSGTRSGSAPSASHNGDSSGGSGKGWLVVLGLGAAAVAAVGGLVLRGRRRTRRELADARADVQPFFDRLAADVASLQPGSDSVARQALADASERFNSAGSQLDSAKTLAQLAGARRSILEGLQATRTARTALGLDPGPDIPPIAQSQVSQLQQPQQLDIAGRSVQGYPQYTPGAPYYFAGGGGYAGGWYSTPFWQSLLIAEALTPGWGFGGWGYGGWGGGGWGGGGYGSGYDTGFERGYEAGNDTGGSGGDWGNTGGGDWGSSGGDWGNSGGSDWGGGGGDWGGGGGGGDSGGSW